MYVQFTSCVYEVVYCKIFEQFFMIFMIFVHHIKDMSSNMVPTVFCLSITDQAFWMNHQPLRLSEKGVISWGIKKFSTVIDTNVTPMTLKAKAVTRKCPIKVLLIEISQNSQENFCARVFCGNFKNILFCRTASVAASLSLSYLQEVGFS